MRGSFRLSSLPTLRRLIIFEATIRLGSIGAAAQEIGLSQPAATHALSKLEAETDSALLERGVGGSSATAAGRILYRRAERMLRRIEASLARLTQEAAASRLVARARRLTDAQIRCHLAVADAGSFRAAAAQLRIAEPTLQRAARRLEATVAASLYQRRPGGIAATPAGARFAAALRLALKEIEQGLEELAAARGLADGRLSIGCLPLMPKPVLARAVGELLSAHPNVAISLEENSHASLMRSLSNGEVDMVLGALRRGRATAGIKVRRLFADPYVVVVGPRHPLARRAALDEVELADFSWVAPWRDTPRRAVLEALFARLPRRPKIVMETSSLAMMSAILAESSCVTILSRSQVEGRPTRGALTILPLRLDWADRTVGVTTRADWLPTRVQQQFLAVLARHSGSQTSFASGRMKPRG
jgi:LysR family transcriptional regulator of gallate degradation